MVEIVVIKRGSHLVVEGEGVVARGRACTKCCSEKVVYTGHGHTATIEAPTKIIDGCECVEPNLTIGYYKCLNCGNKWSEGSVCGKSNVFPDEKDVKGIDG